MHLAAATTLPIPTLETEGVQLYETVFANAYRTGKGTVLVRAPLTSILTAPGGLYHFIQGTWYLPTRLFDADVTVGVTGESWPVVFDGAWAERLAVAVVGISTPIDIDIALVEAV